MIYLIGGAPRVGKTIIAKQFALSIDAPFVSTDDLEDTSHDASVVFYNDIKKNTQTPNERVEAVMNEAKQIIAIIQNIIDTAIKKHQDIIIEGVHLFPSYVDDFIRRFGEENIRVIFVGSTDIELILEGMGRNSSENNWLKDFDQEVLEQIAAFTKAFSHYFLDKSKQYHFHYKERSVDFQNDIIEIMNEIG